jgi:hypothetical protein
VPLDGERVSVRIVFFKLVVENCMRLVTSEKYKNRADFLLFRLVKYYLNDNFRIAKDITRIINYFIFNTDIKEIIFI